ncbi:MAG: hypothetical protein HYR85_13830 [Planctomycetes bacterium]|nr:hypothetical protein [Planctomycetota bacterium]MBI3843564.1 hypothetical protein [Planctomycetota bacterium]
MGKPITDIPPEKVGKVVQSFVDNGEARVDASQQSNGLFTVTPLSAGALFAADAPASRSFAPPKPRRAATKKRAK